MTQNQISTRVDSWRKAKENHDDALLFIWAGDFLETFDDDAAVVVRELGIVLTSIQGAPATGIPRHREQSWIGMLKERGYRVAIS